MHNAPSVSYPVGRSRFAGALAAVAWLAGACGIALWWRASQVSPLPLAWAAAAVLAAGLVALRGWLRAPRGVLAWNGEGWTWKEGAALEPGEPQCVLDVQHTMLLRWDAQACTRWLWVQRPDDPARWADLRRAVYSRARSGPAHAAASEPEPRP